MDLLQNQAYNLWFNWLADKIMEWKDAKPLNKDLRNCVKAMNEIGMFTNTLRTELDIITKRYNLMRSQKNDEIRNLKEQIENLTNELKKYDMHYIDMPEETTYCRTCDKETDGDTYCSKNCYDYDTE